MPADERAEDDGHLPAGLAWRVAQREERFRRAHEVAAEAVTVPASERSAWMQSHPDCLCPEFVELMIAMARERRGEEPRESVRCAHLAVTAIEEYVRLGGADGDDLRALAWAELGNAHRICGDLRLAGIAFFHAQERIRYVSDALVRAEVLSLEASYRDYRREYRVAERLLLRAQRIATKLGTAHLEAKILIKRAEVARSLDRVREAVNLLERGIRILDVRTEPRLALVAIHNLAHYLILLHHSEPATRILQKFRPVYLAFGDERLRLRREWLEATAALQLGLRELGAAMLEDVRQSFAAADSPYEVALVGLDLTEQYVKGEQWADLERVANETYVLCSRLGIEPKGIAAAKTLLETAVRRQGNL